MTYRSLFLAVLINCFMLSSLYATKITGKVSTRVERVENDATNTKESTQQIGVKVEFIEKISTKLSLNAELATGANNSRSYYTNFGSGFTTKDVGLNKAAIKYNFYDTEVTLGKSEPSMFTTSELIFDKDLMVEGLSTASEYDNRFILNAGAYVLDEKVTNDPTLSVLQLGVQDDLGVFAIAFINTSNLTTDYKIFNASTVFTYEKVVFTFDYALNDSATTDDTAWLVSANFDLPRIDLPLNISYRNVEKNSVIPSLTESSFLNGSTDLEGFKLSTVYTFDKINIGASYTFGEVGLNNGSDYNELNLSAYVFF